jgi:DinB family protein
MNPYAADLSNQDAVRVLESTASRLVELSKSLGDSRIAQPLAPGKWSPREIIVHLADCELAFGFRYRQALGEDQHVVQPFDQDKWAKSYAAYSVALALSTFSALRNWNLVLLRSLSPAQLSKSVTHPERGKMEFKELIETAAGHDIHHLSQLEAFARKAA